MTNPQAAKSLDQLTWCRYAAGMVGAYLGLGVDDEKIEAIAGIIHRRLWALAPTQPAPQPEAQALPLTNRLTPYTAVAVAMDLASLLAGSVAMSNKEEADTYSARLRSHLIKYIHAAAQPEPIAALSSPAPAPLSDEQIEDLRGEANRGFCIERADYFKEFRDAERAHGIGLDGGM